MQWLTGKLLTGAMDPDFCNFCVINPSVPQIGIRDLLWAGPVKDVQMNQWKTQLRKNPLPNRGKYVDRETIKFR